VSLSVSLSVSLAVALTMASTVARAQTNIDQGKSPAEIFASDCATCHKSARGLANGKNSLMLSSFLREHYTASRDQAASMAAFVLGAGAGPPVAAQTPGQKPVPDRAKGTADDTKPGRPTRTSAKPDEPTPPTTKPLRPVTAIGSVKNEPEVPPPPTPAPVAAVPAAPESPSASEVPSQMAPATSASGGSAASASAVDARPDAEPADNAPVPRDNIPD
jgi:mono/diheme cytochrome c family protein